MLLHERRLLIDCLGIGTALALLTRDGEESERDKILLDAWLVLSSLVRTGRWRYRAAEQMRRMLEACGPDRVPERVAALV